jgi:hypothetical protein
MIGVKSLCMSLARRAWLRWHTTYRPMNHTKSTSSHQPLTWQQFTALAMAPLIVGMISYLLAIPYL